MRNKVEDSDARRIAERGREALVARLRGAFAEATAAHADVIDSDPEKLERMVQHAAERADGLQWRRALATAATEELGIGLGEALGHPTVARAHAIVGAPSYEEGLAAIAEGRAPPAGGAAWAVADADAAEAKGQPARGEVPESARGQGPEPTRAEAPEPAPEPEAETEPSPEGDDEDLAVNIGVLHIDGLQELGGVGNLELRFSDRGLDIVSEIDDAALLHFDWSDLHNIEVQPWRSRRRRQHSARLIVGTTSRHGTFETRGANLEELRYRLMPALAKLDESP